ncbi:MAG: hypothetical protein BWY88_01197 [Synergistetes bacterium ADurb.Bin520]|nr:MAG: hypothetical protein BWY88_01197 [Synergistetes bacterium ADurb.Bin520]
MVLGQDGSHLGEGLTIGDHQVGAMGQRPVGPGEFGHLHHHGGAVPVQEVSEHLHLGEDEAPLGGGGVDGSHQHHRVSGGYKPLQGVPLGLQVSGEALQALAQDRHPLAGRIGHREGGKGGGPGELFPVGGAISEGEDQQKGLFPRGHTGGKASLLFARGRIPAGHQHHGVRQRQHPVGLFRAQTSHLVLVVIESGGVHQGHGAQGAHLNTLGDRVSRGPRLG